jgi:ABC-type Fe3+-hydroxamate transport system substrate-binding protein
MTSVLTDVLTDAIGVEHKRVSAVEECRIVSLVPSVTELICALGLAPVLVGRTGFCIHPMRTLEPIPKIGGTKDVNIDKIRRLAPTHLVVNIDENEKPTVDELAQFVPHVIVTHPVTPEDNLSLYRLLGGIFGKAQEAEVLCARFSDALSALHRSQTQHDARAPHRVLYCIWQDPWMTVSRDTYIARMLALIGWQQWASVSEARYPVFRWDQQMLEEIDEILLSSEPYRFTQSHADALEKQVGKPVRIVDGEMLSWYGSRAIEGLGYLKELAQTL